MSKKSRKRNKKILAALALAGGAAMLAKGKLGKGAGAATGVVNPNLQKTIAADAATDVTQDTAPVIKKSSFKPRVWPGTMLNERPGPRHALPPSMKGGALHAEGYTPRNLHIRGPIRGGLRGGGIAKRGTGQALKNGGRVKSMGIAKRGGGIAKR